MRSNGELVAGLSSAVEELISSRPEHLSPDELTARIQAAFRPINQLQALICDAVAEFEARGLARADGQAGTKAWLQAFCRLTGQAAHTHVRVADTMRALPILGEAMRD